LVQWIDDDFPCSLFTSKAAIFPPRLCYYREVEIIINPQEQKQGEEMKVGDA
jgi:hypothetical protein